MLVQSVPAFKLKRLTSYFVCELHANKLSQIPRSLRLFQKMEETEREVISEVSSVHCDQTVSLTACEQQNTGGKDETDIDKKLDISSDRFDPLLALYSSEVPLPYPNVKCFNNLAEYESFMKGGRGRAKPENVEKKIRKAKRGVTDPERIERLKKLMVKNPSEEGEESGVKRSAAATKHKAPKNVLTRMPCMWAMF